MRFIEIYILVFIVLFTILFVSASNQSNTYVVTPELPYTKLMKLPFVKLNRIQVGQSRRGFVKYYRAQIEVSITRRTVDGVSKPEVSRKFMCNEDSEHSGFDSAPMRTKQATEAMEFLLKYYDVENERFIN